MKNIKKQMTDIIKSIKRLSDVGKVSGFLLRIGLLSFASAIGNFLYAFGIAELFAYQYTQNASAYQLPMLLLAGGKLSVVILAYHSQKIMAGMKAELTQQYQYKLAEKFASADYPWIEDQKTGDLLGRAETDTKNSALAVSEYLPKAIRSSCILLFTLIMLLLVNRILFLIYFLMIPIIFYFELWGSKQSSRHFDNVRTANEDKNSTIEDMIKNRILVKAYILEEYALRKANLKISKYAQLFSKAVATMTAAMSPAILIAKLPLPLLGIVGAGLVTKGMMDIRGFLAIFMLVMSTSSEIRALDDFVINLPELLSYAKRLFPIWDAPSDKTDGRSKPKASEDERNAIMLSNVSFSYNNTNADILDQLSVTIQNGEKVAIVGNSGSGKSTILKLIIGRYHPRCGSIRLLGMDINMWNLDELAKQVGYVSHRSYFWPKTIRENIRILNSEISEEVFQHILTITLVDKLLKRNAIDLEYKFSNIDTIFSGGEKQKLALARILYKEARIFLFDEATCSIDTADEIKIIDNILYAFPNETMIFATHQYTWLDKMDRILVLDQGKIIEAGTHDVLMKESGKYASLYWQYLREVSSNEK